MMGITYHGKHSLADFNIITKTIDRPILPQKRKNELVIPGRNGSYDFSNDTYDDLLIPVLLQYVGTSFQDLKSQIRSIAVWLNQTDYSQLIFDDEPDKYYLAKVYDKISSESLLELIPAGKATVNFSCHPFAYGAEEVGTFVNDALTVANAGDLIVFPWFVVTFTGSCSEWKVINAVGNFIRIVHSFVLGDTLEINCITGAIYHNGLYAMNLLDWQNSRMDLFKLNPGNNNLTITPTGKSNTIIHWIPQYL